MLEATFVKKMLEATLLEATLYRGYFVARLLCMEDTLYGGYYVARLLC